MRAPDPVRRAYGAYNLRPYGAAAREAIPDLIRLLSDHAKLQWGRDVLNGPPVTLTFVSYEAADTLVTIGEPAVLPLIEAFRKTGPDDWRTLSAAARALGEIGDPRAMEPMIAKMTELSDKGFVGTTADRPQITLAQNVAALGPEAVSPLIDMLKTPAAWDAAAALGILKDSRAIDALIVALDGPAAGPALRALGEIGDRRALEPVAAAAAHRDPLMRFTAVRALAKLKDQRALAPLARVARDKAAETRYEAVQGLRDLGSAEAIAVLTTLANDRRERPEVSSAARDALKALGY
jgi:HEAT repeat protein